MTTIARPGASREQRGQNVQPVLLPQPQIEKDDVERRVADELLGLLYCCRLR